MLKPESAPWSRPPGYRITVSEALTASRGAAANRRWRTAPHLDIDFFELIWILQTICYLLYK